MLLGVPEVHRFAYCALSQGDAVFCCGTFPDPAPPGFFLCVRVLLFFPLLVGQRWNAWHVAPPKAAGKAAKEEPTEEAKNRRKFEPRTVEGFGCRV